MQPLLASERRFQIWLYTASHSQLLLRANPARDGDARIEVLFKAVDWMALPTLMDGLTITEVAPASVGALLEEFHAPFSALPQPTARLFLLEGAAFRAGVVAAGAFVHADHLPYGEPSAFFEQNLSVGVHLRP